MTLPTEHLFADTGENSSIALLKQHFPQCFDKGGLFLPDKLAEQLQTANVPVSREYYTMNWLGKSYARYLCDCPPITLLGEDSAHNTQSQNQHSQNLLIKGDNLEVLKHLKNAYANQVKMIYIDPPYNTGSDGFVYQDDRKFTPDELAKLADMSTDDARRVLDFTAKKSNSHSAWLTFMYPRLYIARELLKEDGVIFISIDDNEQAQLKLLCDEVFGEENFIKDLIINTSEGGGNAKYVVNGHEVVFVYAKNLMKFDNLKRPKDIRGKKVVINDELYWIQEDAIREEFGKYGNLHYEDIIDIKGREFKEKIDLGVSRNEYVLIPKSNGKNIIGKLRKVSDDFSKFHSILNIGYINKHLTTDGIRELEELFCVSKGNSPFETPKPLELLERLVLSATFKGNNNDLILDFFAGSGTTAHAVMQLNAQDNGNRRFICVQIDEPTDPKSEARKAGYPTIFDITQARIEKSAVKIRQDFPDYQGDLGFKIFETMPDFRATDDEISPQLEFPEMLHAHLEPKQYETLLTTWCVYDGNALTQSVQSVELGGYSANLCGTTLYVVYPDFDSVAIKALLDKLDHDADFIIERIVLFGEMVESAKQRELKQALDTYNNKKNVHLSLLVRY